MYDFKAQDQITMLDAMNAAYEDNLWKISGTTNKNERDVHQEMSVLFTVKRYKLMFLC